MISIKAIGFMSARGVIAASGLALVFLVGLGAPTRAYADDIMGLEVSKPTPAPGEEVTIRVRLRPFTNSHYACGVRLSLGDGTVREVRGNDFPEGKVEIKHTYASAGRYSLMAEGKGMVRGLKSVLGCSGNSTTQVAVEAPRAACTPPADEYRAVDCPTGMQGKVLQRRAFACPGPSAGPWVTESTDCKAAPVASPAPLAGPPPAPRPQQRRIVGE